MSTAVEIVVAALMVLGAFFLFVAALGLLRFPDAFMRMATSTKAMTFGVATLILALVVETTELGVAARGAVLLLLLLLSSPVAAHLIGRAAYHDGVPLWERTIVDEYGSEERRRRLEGRSAEGLAPDHDDHT